MLEGGGEMGTREMAGTIRCDVCGCILRNLNFQITKPYSIIAERLTTALRWESPQQLNAIVLTYLLTYFPLSRRFYVPSSQVLSVGPDERKQVRIEKWLTFCRIDSQALLHVLEDDTILKAL
ncbi:unnamed protein product [Hydatigera taeniaeformis]|uniref:Zf-RVT domain-containing protein n=1 Tax=Hydatigena taeniaeformis TaxID=6205 RepID=A0A0R3WKE7_HYDTA|nr:unnamed protein product [Hydatigera taeniaeformis]